MKEVKFFKRCIDGSFREFDRDVLFQKSCRIILYRSDWNAAFCPNHCRWEEVDFADDYSVHTLCGEAFAGLVFPFVELPDDLRGFEPRLSGWGGYCYGEEDKIARKKDLLCDADKVSLDVFVLGVESDGDSFSEKLFSYYFDRVKFERSSSRGFCMTRLSLVPHVKFFSFEKTMVKGDFPELSLPLAVSEFFHKTMQNLVCSFYKKDISFPYPLRMMRYADAYIFSPFELNAYPLLKRFTNFKVIQANDMNVYNKICSIIGIKSAPTLRKAFTENPISLLRYKAMLNMGFSDVNIIFRALTKEGDMFFETLALDSDCQESLSLAFSYFAPYTFYVKESLKERDEAAVWRALNRDESLSQNDRSDAARMFSRHFENLSPLLRSEIIREGLTRYTHDVLSKLDYEIRNKNVEFSYSEKERSWEDEIEGWKFFLAKDSYQLKEVGLALHNCVASYRDRVLNRDCVIVYVQKNEKYMMCIEVRPENKIHQYRADRNSTPTGEALAVFSRWAKSHNLTFGENRF